MATRTRTQPEAERRNVQLLLRLPPDAVAWIRSSASQEGRTISDWVLNRLRRDSSDGGKGW